MKLLVLLVLVSCVGVSLAGPATSTSIRGTWSGTCYQYAGTTAANGSAPLSCISAAIPQSYSVAYNGTHVSYKYPQGSVQIGTTTYYVAGATATYLYSVSNGQVQESDVTSGSLVACYYVDISGGVYSEKGTYLLSSNNPQASPCATISLDSAVCNSTAGTYNYRCVTPAPSSAATLLLSQILVFLVVGCMFLLL